MSINDFVYNAVKDTFGGVQDKVDGIAKQLIVSPEKFNPEIWNIVHSINTTFLAIAYSLLALFFLIELTKKSASIEITWEQVAKVLFKTCFLKMVIEKSFVFLNIIFDISVNATNAVNSVNSTSLNSTVTLNKIKEHINSLGMFDAILYYISIFPLSIVMQLIGIAIPLILYGRFIEIYIYTAVAPIPMTTLANESLSHTGKNFLQSYAAVCFQAVVILIGCKIYGGMVAKVAVSGNGTEALKDIVIMSLLLLFILIKSGVWAKKLTGAT